MMATIALSTHVLKVQVPECRDWSWTVPEKARSTPLVEG